jgi:pimeloyl-ACP methyl ester carboxylesterase
MSSGNGYERVNAELEQARSKRWFNNAKAQQDDSFGALPKPIDLGKPVGRSLLWFRQEMNYDPMAALRALRVPALFLFGDRDELIPVQESVIVLQRVQGEDAHHDFTIREFANDDHEMRVDVGVTSGEIDPEYLRTMREWLASHVLKD